MTREESFWARVDKSNPDGCWPWTGSTDQHGYGRHGNSKMKNLLPGGYVAHRISYTLMVGPIPAGLHIDHLCRNPSCVNPAHLEPVTQRENNLRGTGFSARHARVTHCPQGHEYTPENTYKWRGARYCKACYNAKRKARRRLLRAESA